MFRLSCATAVLLLHASAALASDGTGKRDIASLFTEGFVAAWEKGDADGIAALWEDSGDWMSIVGSRRISSGHDTISTIWGYGLDGRDTEASRRVSVDVDAINMLADGVAQVDLIMTYGSPGEPRYLREAMVAVVRKHADGWKIATCRVARMPE